jgi:hypothetical protein
MKPLVERDLTRFIEDVKAMSITSIDHRVIRALCEDLLERKKSNIPETTNEVPPYNQLNQAIELLSEVMWELTYIREDGVFLKKRIDKFLTMVRDK